MPGNGQDFLKCLAWIRCAEINHARYPSQAYSSVVGDFAIRVMAELNERSAGCRAWNSMQHVSHEASPTRISQRSEAHDRVRLVREWLALRAAEAPMQLASCTHIDKCSVLVIGYNLSSALAVRADSGPGRAKVGDPGCCAVTAAELDRSLASWRASGGLTGGVGRQPECCKVLL